MAKKHVPGAEDRVMESVEKFFLPSQGVVNTEFVEWMKIEEGLYYQGEIDVVTNKRHGRGILI